MYALATDPLLYYKITLEPTGCKIRIWETPDTTVDGQGPYLYILTRQVNDLAEAKAVLSQHLALNGGALTCDQAEFPHKGKIRLMAFPTWNDQDGSSLEQRHRCV